MKNLLKSLKKQQVKGKYCYNDWLQYCYGKHYFGASSNRLYWGRRYFKCWQKTKDVQAIVTNAGKSGTNADALYYRFIAVPSDAANNYKVGNTYDLKKLKGKKVSFVTNSSTSGFVVPGEVLVKEFGLKNTDELLQEGKVFSKVIFGNSHPGTQVNLLKKDVDVATFAIPKSFNNLWISIRGRK